MKHFSALDVCVYVLCYYGRLVVAHIHQYTLVVAWVVAVTWAVVVLDHTIDVSQTVILLVVPFIKNVLEVLYFYALVFFPSFRFNFWGVVVL